MIWGSLCGSIWLQTLQSSHSSLLGTGLTGTQRYAHCGSVAIIAGQGTEPGTEVIPVEAYIKVVERGVERDLWTAVRWLIWAVVFISAHSTHSPNSLAARVTEPDDTEQCDSRSRHIWSPQERCPTRPDQEKLGSLLLSLLLLNKAFTIFAFLFLSKESRIVSH